MFHLHVNENFSEHRDESPKKKYTAEVMGEWYMLYRKYVQIYLVFYPGEVR
jgi:hypothetical protein